MKKTVLTSILFLFVAFSFTVSAQETKTIKAVYEGSTDDGFKFTTINNDGSETTMAFQRALPELIQKFELDEKTNIGKGFKITYKVTTEEIEYDTEDGKEVEEGTTEKVYTIIALENNIG